MGWSCASAVTRSAARHTSDYDLFAAAFRIVGEACARGPLHVFNQLRDSASSRPSATDIKSERFLITHMSDNRPQWMIDLAKKKAAAKAVSSRRLRLRRLRHLLPSSRSR